MATPVCILSNREKEVLKLVSKEKTTMEISKLLHISPETAKSHRKSLLQKMEAKNSAGLVRKAFEKGLLHIG